MLLYTNSIRCPFILFYVTWYMEGPLIGFFNLVIPAKIFPQSRIFIGLSTSRTRPDLVPGYLIFGEPVEDGRIRKVVRSK